MAGPKDIMSPEQYERWYARHRQVERQRQWAAKLQANPIEAIPEAERGDLPQTFSLQEAFYHKLSCDCGSCASKLSEEIKKVRLAMRPTPPAVRSRVSPLPELPSQVLPLLQDVVERVLSTEGAKRGRPVG